MKITTTFTIVSMHNQHVKQI